MKLTKIVTFCATAVASTLLFANAQAQAFKDGKAKVVNIQGSATYTAPGSTDSVKLKTGMILKPGTAITTAADSIVDLFLGVNGPVVRVIASSTLTLDKLSYSETGTETVIETSLDLKAGTILGNVKHLASSSQYNVKIPNGVCGIRGTQFQVSSSGNVTVIQGSVQITYNPPGGAPITVTVNAGQSFTPPAGTVSFEVKPTDSATVVQVNLNAGGSAGIIVNPNSSNGGDGGAGGGGGTTITPEANGDTTVTIPPESHPTDFDTTPHDTGAPVDTHPNT